MNSGAHRLKDKRYLPSSCEQSCNAWRRHVPRVRRRWRSKCGRKRDLPHLPTARQATSWLELAFITSKILGDGTDRRLHYSS